MPHRDRAHQRFNLHLSAEFKVQGRVVTAVTRNVSVGGAAIECGPASFKEGEALELSLFLVVEGVEDADKPPLEVGARVQWLGEGDDGSHVVGVRFERITPEQVKWLERFLAVSG
jgi:hypothetical protein